MKAIVKLIVFGVAAGLAYTYATEGDFNIGNKFKEVMQQVEEFFEETQNPEQNGRVTNTGGGETFRTVSFNEEPGNTEEDAGGEEVLGEALEFPEREGYGENILYTDLDTYASEVPDYYEDNLQALVEYLIRPAKDDMEKARLLFYWIAANIRYDDQGYNTGNYGDCTSEGVLRSRTAVCAGFSELFCAMGQEAGLEIIKISGYSKGVSYIPGKRFNAANHAWNAIRINGGWKLFDVTWAQGYGTTDGGTLRSAVKFDDFWFDTDPYVFLFSHLPVDADKQFIDRPISREDFESMPEVPESFFKFGFEGKTCLRKVLNGEIKEFPDIYSTRCRVKAISLPTEGRLESGTPLKFVIKSEDATDLKIINNGEFIPFSKEGDTFTLVFTPKEGDLTVCSKLGVHSAQYEYIIGYRVI